MFSEIAMFAMCGFRTAVLCCAVVSILWYALLAYWVN